MRENIGLALASFLSRSAVQRRSSGLTGAEPRRCRFSPTSSSRTPIRDLPFGRQAGHASCQPACITLYGYKDVGMLQQNWALIDSTDNGCLVYFVHDGSGVSDELTFNDQASAATALHRNGFDQYAGDPEAVKFVSPPQPPFRVGNHPNGRIYSSGQHWH